MDKKVSTGVIAAISRTSQRSSKSGEQTNSKHPEIVETRSLLWAMIDDSAATYARPTKSTFPKSLEHLKRPGVNITDFNSTVDNEGLE